MSAACRCRYRCFCVVVYSLSDAEISYWARRWYIIDEQWKFRNSQKRPWNNEIFVEFLHKKYTAVAVGQKSVRFYGAHFWHVCELHKPLLIFRHFRTMRWGLTLVIWIPFNKFASSDGSSLFQKVNNLYYTFKHKCQSKLCSIFEIGRIKSKPSASYSKKPSFLYTRLTSRSLQIDESEPFSRV